ncbi:MAG TPA: TonB-dependent receptor, partial [Pirellulaceae bacterium]|nr:TonB-dependent receptor [Pirellulaceae bacterium]
FGVFSELARPISDDWRVTTGARVDWVTNKARADVPGMGVLTNLPPVLVETPLDDLKQAGLDQSFTPLSLYATTDYAVNDRLTLLGGVGYAMRPPSLTELYAAGPFIGSAQPGLSFVEGDPTLDPEQLIQVDFGGKVDYGRFRASANAFHAWVHDYITLEDFALLSMPPLTYTPGQDLQRLAYVNTNLATLAGFELKAEHDLTDWLSLFALGSYVEGRDHTRDRPSRLAALVRDENFAPTGPRSLNTSKEEPLPGMPPLEGRFGVRLHEASRRPVWMVEFETRVVDQQDRVAASLWEQPTPGFAVFNLRGYVRPAERFMLLAGVENLGDRLYREHLDYRTGLGVFRPGVTGYVATEIRY